MTVEFTTDEGKRVVINPAPFEVACALREQFAFTACMLNLASSTPMELGLRLLPILEGNKQFKDTIFEALGRCLYNGEKITLNTFKDDIEARGYYYKIIVECLSVNLSPFFVKAPTQLSDLLGKLTSILQPE